jgi:hypothetical protein
MMDDADKAQDIQDRLHPEVRGRYFPDRFPFTETTPYANKADDIQVGQRGSPDGVRVFYRHACGKLINLGRPTAISQSLDDVKFIECPGCHRS